GELPFPLPRGVRGTLLAGLSAVLFLSVFQDLLQLLLQGGGPPGAIRAYLFDLGGPSLRGAASACVLTWAISATWRHRREAVRARIEALPEAGRRALRWGWIGLAVACLLLVPVCGGPFVEQVVLLGRALTRMGVWR